MVKPSPSALKQYLLNAEELGNPLQVQDLAPQATSMAVEIGFGGGEYLAWWASQHPDWTFLGMELPVDCMLRAARVLQQAKVDNVRLIRGDARYLLREIFAPQSLHHVLMQFPMPWPKEKHAKHRVSSPQFAQTLADVLVQDGIFELVTDQDWYAKETAEVFAQHPDFLASEIEVQPHRPFQTRYEQKWLEEGRSIYRLVVRLLRPSHSSRILLPQPMDCFSLSPSLVGADVKKLLGSRFKQGDSVVEVKEVFAAGDGWMLRVLSSDHSFSQLFHLRIRKKKDGRCLLKVDEVPRPYYTQAVRFALKSIHQALQQGEVEVLR